MPRAASKTQPTRATDSTPLMNDAELARRLNVPVGWVEDKAKRQQIPCTFIGKHRRYSEAHYQQIVSADERPALNAGRAA